MILTLIFIGLAFTWLLYETNWMRVRLPTGKTAKVEAHTPVIEQSKRKWQFLKYGDDALLLCHQCRNRCHPFDDKHGWFGWRIPARTIKICGSTINFKAGCNLYRAKLIKSIIREQKCKTTISHKLPQLPLFIEQVKTGSHWEKERWTDRIGKKHECNSTVVDYTQKFDDCLPGKDWLKAHYKDEYPETTMELVVDGKLVANINGTYKKGMISQALKPYTTKARVGKHNVIFDFGEADRIAP